MRRLLTVLVFVVGWGLLGGQAQAQETIPSPPALAEVVKQRVASELKPGAGGINGATRFKPSGKRILIPDLARRMASNPEQRESLQNLFEEGMKIFEAEAEKQGTTNDVAAALTFFTAAQWSIYNGGGSISDAREKVLIKQFQATLNVPEMRNAGDAEKQALYEWYISTSMFSLVMSGQAEKTNSAETAAGVRVFAGKMLTLVFGVAPDRVHVGDKGLEIANGGAATAPTAIKPGAPTRSAGSAGRVTFAAPSGWQSETDAGATILTRAADTENAAFRLIVLPASPSSSSPREDFQRLWKEAVLGVFETDVPPLPFFYRLPSGSTVLFDGALMRNKNEPQGGARSIFLYVVRVGATTVPVLAVQDSKGASFNDLGEIFTGKRAAALNQTLTLFLNSIRVAGESPKPVALLDRSQFVGTWHGTVTMSMASYVSRATGAYTGDASSGISNEYTFKADGTFSQLLLIQFNGKPQPPARAWGRWTLEGDTIVLKVQRTEGSMSKDPERRLKIAGYGKDRFGTGTAFYQGNITLFGLDGTTRFVRQ